MESTEVARIARDVVREYGLPLSLMSVSMTAASGWTVLFTADYGGAPRVAVDTRCDSSSSAYRLRESLKAKLDVSE
jgi:hypothetical protein